MIVAPKSVFNSLPSLPGIGEIREFVRYASEHQLLLLGIVGGLFLLSVLCSKEQNKILMVLYSVVVVYLTLLSRTVGIGSISLSLFWSYRLFWKSLYLRRQVLNNIILFIPYGFFLCRLKPNWSTFKIPIAISLLIELLQYLLDRGCFELDDIISNSLGGLIGLTAGMLWIYAIRFFNKLKGWLRSRDVLNRS